MLAELHISSKNFQRALEVKSLYFSHSLLSVPLIAKITRMSGGVSIPPKIILVLDTFKCYFFIGDHAPLAPSPQNKTPNLLLWL